MSLAENYNPVTQTDQLLLMKKGIYSNEKNVNALRNVIKNEQRQLEYKQSKPFSKKYGSQNTTAKLTQQNATELRQSQSNQHNSEKEIEASKTEIQHKNNTKQSFNKKLNNNIIKDQIQHSPNSKQSYRIKKISDNKLLSSKQTRDSLMNLNEEEGKLQRQILELHKNTKSQLQKIKQYYQIANKRLSDLLPQANNEQGNVINWQKSENTDRAVQRLDLIIKQKQKQLLKIEQKIAKNEYLQYLQNMPEDIEQLNESQQEDIVDQLPLQKPTLQGNRGCYSITMTNMKNKNYALNLRRTYDIFKEDQDKSEAQVISSPMKSEAKQQIVKQQGQIRMTLNQKFKDFLLN